MAAPRPIASVAGGGVKYSDGSIRYPNAKGNASQAPKPASGYSNRYQGNQSTFNTLGASTQVKSSTPQIQGGGQMNVSNGGGGDQGGGGEIDYSQQISDLYNPALQNLSDIEGQIRSGYPEEESNLTSSIENERKKALTQEGELLGDVDEEQGTLTKKIQSALSEAVRAFNALQQQSRSRFGFGSSAGQAVGELAQQEYFKNQGNLQQQEAEGNLQLSKERVRIKTYVQQKMDDLDQYKKEAMLSLKQNFQDRLNEINARRGDIEANKARDRMSILQGVVENARMIQQQDKDFRRQLGLAAVSKMQEVAGRAFTPKEITAVMQDFGVEMSSISNPATQNSAVTFKPRNQEDELTESLNPIQQ